MSNRFASIIIAIDAANAQDPNLVAVDGSSKPAELAYAGRMSEMLDRIYPNSSELLRIAARAQHIERWKSPRSSYPEGRIGYLKWRTELKNFHATRTGELMAQSGYDDQAIARVQSLIRKERMKYDPEAQALEDVICLVFLEDYLAAFAPKHSEDKVIDILRKTWVKMSKAGQTAALELDLNDTAKHLVRRALSTSDS